jgi:hypothetical protein
MKKYIVLQVLLFVFLIGESKDKYDNIKAFTHPLDIKHSVSIYHTPGNYFRELKPDVEAGWIINVKQREKNYFKIDILDLKILDIWIHVGDIGVVVQNYDSIALPIFSRPDTNSIVINFVYKSCIGLIYDISDNFFLLQVITEEACYFGWVERRFLCYNPYTTCG